jgi:hypothetical protein
MGRQRGGQPVQRQPGIDLVVDGIDQFAKRTSMLAQSVQEGVVWPETALAEVMNNGCLPAPATLADVDALLEAITLAWKGAGASPRHRLGAKRYASQYFMMLALSGAYACTINDHGRIEV